MEDNVKEIILKVNGDDAEKKLDALNKKLEDTKQKRKELSDAAKGRKMTTEEEASMHRLDKVIKDCNKDLRRMTAGADEVTRTLHNMEQATPKELRRTLKALTAALSGPHMKRGSKEWAALQEKIKLVRAEIQKVNDEQKEAMSMSDRFAEWGNKWMGIAEVFESTAEALSGIKMAAGEAVDAYLQMDEAQVAVRKYTGLSVDAVKELNEVFKKMDTRTPREKLNALAADAGRLGITSREAIIDFVDAANMINVALGEDLGEDAVKNIGKLAQLFGDDKKIGLKQAMISTGSVINELAQTSSANEGYIMDFTARLAGMAKQANMSQAQVMALASVMDQSMVNAEEGSTALMKVIQQIYREPAKMAAAAGLEVDKFTALVKTDANEALLQFAEAVSKMGGMDKIAPMLGSLSLTGAGVSKAIATLANQVDKVRAAQTQATEAFRTGESVINEYNTANNSQSAIVEKNKKKIEDLRIELGEKLQPILAAGLSTSSRMISVATVLLEFGAKHMASIIALTAVIATFTIALNASVIAEKAHALWAGICTKAQVLWAAKTVVANLAVTLFTKGLAAAKAQFLALNTAMKANVIGLVTAGISFAIVALMEFINKEKTAVQNHRDSMDAIERANKKADDSTQKEIVRINKLVEMINNNAYSYDTKRKAMLTLQKIVPGFQAALGKEIKLTKENTTAINDYITGLQNKAKAEAYYEELVEAQKKVAAAKRKVGRKQFNVESVNAEMARHPEKYASNRGAIYTTFNTSMGAQQVYAGVGERNQDLIKKTKELKTQEKALKDANAELAKAENLVRAIKQQLKSDKDVDAAFSDLIVGTDTGIGTGGGGEDPLQKRIDKINTYYAQQQLIAKTGYYNGLIDKEVYDKKVKDLELLKINDLQKLYQKDSSNWIDLENKRLDLLRQNQAYSLKEIEIATKEKEHLALKDYANGVISEKEYQQKLTDIRLEALRQKAELLKMDNPDSPEAKEAQLAYEEELLSDKLEKRKTFEAQAADFQKEYGKKSIEEQKAFELATLDELVKQKVISAEDAEKYRKQIEEKYKESGDKSPLGGAMDPLSSGVIQLGTAIDNLQGKLDSGKVSWQDYASVAVASLGMISTLANAASQLMQANINAETAKINERYDAEIKAAGKNSRKAKRLEERRQNEIAKVKSKYAKKAMAMEIAGAVAQTAVAAINAYASASKVSWILGPIAAAAAVAAGAIQIATIRKQHQAQASGYYSGGFTGGRNYHNEAGVVHEGEWVGNHELVGNPNVFPLLSMLDYAQRNNRAASLTATDVSRAVAAPQQTASAVMVGQSPIIVQETQRTSEALEKLGSMMDKGIPAYVVIDGPDGLKKQMDKYNKLTNN